MSRLSEILGVPEGREFNGGPVYLPDLIEGSEGE